MTRAIGKDGTILDLIDGYRFMVSQGTKRATVLSLTAILTELETGRKALIANELDLFITAVLADDGLTRSRNVSYLVRVGLLCLEGNITHEGHIRGVWFFTHLTTLRAGNDSRVILP